MGHEQAVSIAGEKDSTTAKATSSVHVPHKDASTMDIQETKVEDNWTDSDIKVAGDLNKDVKTNVVPKEKKEGEEDQDQEYTEIVETEELTEEELEIQRIEQENQ